MSGAKRKGTYSEISLEKSKQWKIHDTVGTGLTPEQENGFTWKQNELDSDTNTKLDHNDLYELSESHRQRFRQCGELDEIGKAIKCGNLALNKTPDGHPDLSHRHGSIGKSYTYRFRRLGELSDMEESIKHFSRALELTPEGHPHLSQRQANLGLSYSDRFRRLGNLDDHEKAMKHFSRALDLIPEGHPDRLNRHSKLGASYADRFRRLGDRDDLEKAIQHKSLALKLTPDGHPHKSRRHASLGVSYADRFHRLSDLDDLEKAIEHGSRALKLTPDGHPHLSTWHAGLGIYYTAQFRQLDNLDALREAIVHKSRALELTPDGHPDLSRRHTSLGVSYHDRFRRLGDIHDLEKATELHSRALELIPDRHPHMLDCHFNQAEAFVSWYRHTGDSSHLNKSMDFFRKASQLLTGAPRAKFEYALHWTKVACTHSSESPDCIEAYKTAINLLPQFIWLGATAAQQYYDLSTAKNLAVNAASVAILRSDPKLALEWLEHARCVVWNQTIMLQSPVDELRSSHPTIADRLQTVSRYLHSGSSESSIDQSISSSGDPCNLSQHRYRLAREYDGLIAQIRTFPGHEEFLLPMKADRLVLAARTGPIAVINCHTDRCDALIILPGQDNVMHLPLLNFTEGKARSARSELYSALQAKGLRERGFNILAGPECRQDIGRVLASLWHHIVKPVLDFLGYTTSASPTRSHLPHITWCPTGALSFLPLHAAGDYDQPGSRVFDYVISSYTPTLTALLASTPTTLDCASRVLAIGQAHTPGHSPLPGTAKELELVKAKVQARAEYSQLIGEQATTADVLDAMEQYDWIHLACHAHQNIIDPTKSGFHLHDGTLDLASISRRSFKNKGLAFLSACQTATGDEKLPDEVIHLASGMLMAGYPSVIATMWSVIDSDAPLVADKVYAELMKGGKVGNKGAGEALHHAVAALREEVGEKQFVRWVPYIHIGR